LKLQHKKLIDDQIASMQMHFLFESNGVSQNMSFETFLGADLRVNFKIAKNANARDNVIKLDEDQIVNHSLC